MPPKKPIKTLELTGTLAHNRGRYDSREIPGAHGALGDPPLHMTIDAQACWHELKSLAPEGLLGRSDRLAAEILSNLQAEFRRDPANFPAAKITLLQRLLSKFAMLPADRAMMKLPAPKEPGPFDEFCTPMDSLIDDKTN